MSLPAIRGGVVSGSVPCRERWYTGVRWLKQFRSNADANWSTKGSAITSTYLTPAEFEAETGAQCPAGLPGVCKLVHSGASTSEQIAQDVLTTTLNVPNFRNTGMLFYMPTIPSNFNYVRWRIYGPTSSDYKTWAPDPLSERVPGWVLTCGDASDNVVADGGTWNPNPIYAYRISMAVTTTAGGFTIYVGGMFVNLTLRQDCVTDKIPVVIEQDDMAFKPSTDTFAREMEARGFRGVFNCIANNITGASNHPSIADMQAYYASGHDIAVHGAYGHNDPIFTSQQMVQDDIKYNQDFVLAYAGPRAAYHYAQPLGQWRLDGWSTTSFRNLGMLSGRGVGATNRQGMLRLWSGGPADWYNLPSKNWETSAANMTTVLNKALAHPAPVIFVTHVIDYTGGITLAQFTEPLDVIKSYSDAGDIVVMTRSELYDLLTGPRFA